MATKLKPKITKVALVDAGANPEATIEIYKAASEPITDTKEPAMADDIQKNLDEVTAERDAMRAELDALTTISNDDLAALKGFEIAKADETEEVLKGLPEDVRKRLEDSEAKIAKMEADARVETFTKRASTDFAKVGDHAEIGEILAALPAEQAEAVEKVLRSANERIDMSVVLKTVGTDGDADADPIAKAKARAEELKKADPAISDADALSAAMREDPAAAKDAFYATK